MFQIKITETPRDAMQGLKPFIPTEVKANYINSLLKVGFDTIDFGSFVSPKAIPQLADTPEVLSKLDLSNTNTKLLAIIGNIKGAERAAEYEKITYLGFPFSVSETFLKLNIKSTFKESLKTIEGINNLCIKKNKEPLIYLSMAFGNPYGDRYDKEIVYSSIEHLQKIGIKIIVLADTLGIGDKSIIHDLYSTIIPCYPKLEFGFHLHVTPKDWREKVDSAYRAGCKRFDSAILGLGGCPMSSKDMVGNLNTENLVDYLKEKNEVAHLNLKEFENAVNQAKQVFN